MGLLDEVKKIYYSGEDLYYDMLDGINGTVPIYTIVDPIDKVFPSFALLLVAILLLAAGGLFALSGGIQLVPNDTLTVSVLDSQNAGIQGATVTFTSDGAAIGTATTNAAGFASQAGMKKGDSVDVRVEKTDYLTATDTVNIDELPKTKIFQMQKQSDSFVQKTISLVDDLGSAIRTPVTLTFRCSNPYAPPIAKQELQSTDNGVAKVNVPGNCGQFTVSVSDSVKYKDVTGQLVTGDQVIHLQEAENAAPTGKLTANVADSTGKGIDGIQVNLYKYADLAGNPNVGPITSSFTSGGQATFTVPAGDYVVKTYDTAGAYGDASSDKISLQANGTASASLTLTENIKGKISVKVLDAASNAPLVNARVKLVYGNNQELATQNVDSAGKASFSISRDVPYTAIATADGYALGTATGLHLGGDYNINISACTPSTCGSLVVQVTDQDNNPMQNATVAIYNAATNSLAGFDTRTTDINGTATFSGMGSGTYYAFAFKESFSGKSDAVPFSGTAAQGSAPNLTVKMTVGDGTIAVNVKDADGNPLPFAQLSMIDERTGQLVKSDFTDNNGSKQFTLRADKKIFIVASKPDDPSYAAYTTVARPMIASGTQTFDITLEKRILKDNVELKFMGLYLGGQRATTLKAGITYTAKLKLYVPEEKGYTTAGVHLRTGDDVLMEKDKLYIKEVDAPLTAQVRVTSLQPKENGLDTSDYSTTVGDAKWVNLEWSYPQPGVYEVEAQIAVRDSATIGDQLPFYYRAWGVKGDGTRDRFPVDTSVTKELYADAKEELFQVDTITLCDDKFCFAATITDESQKLKGGVTQQENITQSITDTYNAGVFNPYRLKFIITNNSDTRIHNNANLRVSNADKVVKFFDYKLTDADGRETSGVLNGFEFPNISAGNLGPKGSIRFEAVFTPQKAGNGLVNIRLVSDQAVVYDKTITVIVSSPNDLDAAVSPSVVLSGVANDVTVTVKDKATNLEVQGAVVRVKDKHDNIVFTATTDAAGVAKVTLPGQNPGDKLFVEAEKPNYNSKVVELDVSDQLLEIKPSQIGASLDTKTKQESDDKFTVRNVSPYALTIRGITLGNDFRNVVDTTKAQGWLDDSYKGMMLKPDEQQELVLKTFITEDAKALTQRQSFSSQLTITANNFGQDWVFQVPVKVDVGLGGEVDNPACLSVSKSQWGTTTSGSPAYTELQIQNNCTAGGKPVALSNLQAKVDWKSNQLGTYSLSFTLDTANKEGQKVDLRSGYFRKLVGTIQPEQTISAILTFTPFGGVNGVANADVTIQAINPQDAQEQVLSNTIKTTVTAANLEGCLTYDKERVEIKQGEAGTITVTATDKCGEPVKMSLESKLRTTPKQDFTIEPGKSQAIQVFAGQSDPGVYPIYLTGKFSSQQKQQLTKDLRVVINAPGCWQLSKYEFDVYHTPNRQLDGFDTANLQNTCKQKPVGVRVNTKDFMQALSNGFVWGIASMGLTMLTNAADPNCASFINCKQTPAQAAASKAAQQKAQAAQQAPAAGNTQPQGGGNQGFTGKGAGHPVIDQSVQQAIQAQMNDAGTNPQGYRQVNGAWVDGQGNAVTDPVLVDKLNSWSDAIKTNASNKAGPGSPNYITPLYPAQGNIPQGVPLGLANGEYVYEASTSQWYRYASNGGKVPVTDTGPVNYLNSIGTDIGVNGNKQAFIGASAQSTQQGTPITPTTEPLGYAPNGQPLQGPPAPNSGQVVLAPTPFTVLAPSPQGISIPGTGQASLFGGGSVGSAVAGQLGGGVFGNLLGGGAGLVRGIFGTSPWAAGVLGLVMGTAISYMSQQSEVNFTVLQKDAEVQQLAMVQGAPPNEQPDNEIRLDVEGFGKQGAPTAPQPLVNNPNLISQGTESFRLTFTNTNDFTTTVDKPKYKTMKVNGVRHVYLDKTYDKKDFFNSKGGIPGLGAFSSSVLDPNKTQLAEDTPQPLEQRWNLEFSAVPPQVETPQRPDLLLDCQAGDKVGATGPDALPKVKFAWNWNAIDEKSCNEDNPNGIYCDATQFSIALLKKINSIQAYVAQNGSSFQCPSPIEDQPAVNEIGPQDVGIASVSVAKDGKKVIVIASIKNTNPGQVTANVSISAAQIGTSTVLQCPDGSQNITLNGGSTQEVKCTFQDLSQGYYQAKASIVPSVSCDNCGNKAASDSLSRNFFAGTSGLQQCTPYSTARLDKFVQASGISGADSIVKMAKFKATLMQDGYSTAFQRDFDTSQRQTFFNAPDFYLNANNGLGIYFSNPKLLSFAAYSQPDFSLPGPGTYDVTIDINYADNSWQLFDTKGNPNANIVVRMQKLHGAQPDSPFYYTPLDGLVGVGGRTGYGMNFNGDSILIDNSPNPVRTVEIAGSAPIPNGILNVNKSTSFKAMQVDNPGVVARLNRSQGNPQLLFQPSNATPVILQVNKNSGKDAYAVYQVGVNGSAVDVGPTMAKWNGVGILCRAFNDEILAQQQNVPDTHMISSSCSVARSGDRSLYTLEFCGEPKRFGTASYETIFYTPQGTDSFVKLSGAASDSATLIGVQTKAQNVQLNGNGVTKDVTSLQDVFDMVRDGYICTSSTNIDAEFFWNPKKIYDLINSKEEQAINACIPSQSSNIKGQ